MKNRIAEAMQRLLPDKGPDALPPTRPVAPSPMPSATAPAGWTAPRTGGVQWSRSATAASGASASAAPMAF